MNVLRYLRSYAGADLNAAVISTVSHTMSEWFSFSDADKVGIAASVGAAWTATTTNTLDIALEMSPDGGTTWFPSPAAENASTGAALTQITTTSNVAEFWPVNIIQGGKATNALGRFTFTYGATNDEIPVSIWLSLRKTSISP